MNNTRHHAMRGALAADVDVAVVRVAHELQASTIEFPIKFVQHDVRQQRRQWTTLRCALCRRHHDTVWQRNACSEHRPDELEHGLVVDARGEPRHQPVVVHTIEELLQIEIHDVLRTPEQMLASARHRRVTAPTRTKSVAAVVKRRLKVRTEHMMHSLLHDAVDDIRDAKASLATTALWNPHAPDKAGTVAAVEQCSPKLCDHNVEVISHFDDAHAQGLEGLGIPAGETPVCTGCTTVYCDVPKGTSEIRFVRY